MPATRGARASTGSGLTCVPGFIDTHLHVESSLVTPLEFDRCVLRHGVTTAICDPHEIANVLGLDGIRYFLAAAERTVMDLRVNLSSCVPGDRLRDVGRGAFGRRSRDAARPSQGDRPRRVHEFSRRRRLRSRRGRKLVAFQDGHIDGHAPLLSGRDLNGYLAARIRTDHEATSAAEAREKLAKGMTMLIREGSVSKDLHALAEVLDETPPPSWRSAPTTAIRSTSPRRATSIT